MNKQLDDITYIRFDTPTKDLIKLRAMRSRQYISDFVRDLVAQALGEPTPEERAFFLTSDAQDSKHSGKSEKQGA